METIFLKDEDVLEATKILKSGGIGIFPTDTVYGIGCDFLNVTSLKRLFEAKKRDLSKPINILVSNINMLDGVVTNIKDIEKTLMESIWPGALTIIFNKTNLVPDLLTSGLDTVGIRMPDNTVCLDLINKFGKPIATSSANISNEPATNFVDENLIKKFNNNVDFILDSGKIDGNVPSTIVRVVGNKVNILREGPISLNDIMEVIKNVR